MYFISRASYASTTVVILRTPSHVVMGTDSKAGLWAIQKNSKHINLAESVCKIRASSGVYFSTAGFVQDGEFDSYRVVEGLLKPGKTIEQQAATIADRVKLPFLHEMERFHKFLPADYAIATQSPGPNMSIGIAAIEKNIPAIGLIDFTVINNGSGSPTNVRVVVKTCPGSACVGTADQDHFWIYGQRAAVLDQIQLIGGKFWSNNDAQDVRKMIQIELTDQPSKVGPPIDILLLDSTGQHWIEPYGSCHNTKSSPKTERPKAAKK
jgi:hypothetical protein